MFPIDLRSDTLLRVGGSGLRGDSSSAIERATTARRGEVCNRLSVTLYTRATSTSPLNFAQTYHFRGLRSA